MNSPEPLFGLDIERTRDDWYTPPWIFESMGVEFDLDVAAPPGGVPWVPATRYYTAADDGLAQPWNGFVWCNPPYSAPLKWAERWADHGNGIILLRADLSTKGPFVAYEVATTVYVPRPRLSFVNGFGGRSSSTAFTTVLFGLGNRADAALVRLGSVTKGLTKQFGSNANIA